MHGKKGVRRDDEEEGRGAGRGSDGGSNGRGKERMIPFGSTGCNRYCVMRSRGLSAGRNIHTYYITGGMFQTRTRIIHVINWIH